MMTSLESASAPQRWLRRAAEGVRRPRRLPVMVGAVLAPLALGLAGRWRSRLPRRATQATAGIALGALAGGAIAIGAMSIGALAISRMAVRSMRISRLRIDQLDVRQASGSYLVATGTP